MIVVQRPSASYRNFEYNRDLTLDNRAKQKSLSPDKPLNLSLITLHHSGSSAIYPILRDYLAFQGYKTTVWDNGDIRGQLRDLGSPLFYYGHNPFTDFESLIHRPDLHVVTLNRDPRDVLCSWVFDEIYMHNINPKNSERMLMAYMSEQTEQGRRFKESIYQAVLWSAQSKATVLRFDEMKRDIGGTIIQILDAAHVKKHDTIISELVKKYDFRSMTNATDTTSGQIVRNNDGFYREGHSGSWKTHFTPRVKEIFKNNFGELCSKLGYNICK